MYNAAFFHDARMTCTQVADLLISKWQSSDDAEHLRNVLQDLLDLKAYLHAQQIEAEDREAAAARG